MTFKTITVKESAYRKIKAAKGPEESFSEFFERSFPKQDVMSFSGILSEGEATEAMRKIRRERERANKDEMREQDALSRL